MSIEIRSLAKRFGAATVIDDLTLRFASGKISVLLGPSGCGKTTTLRCIAGLEEPASGEILIEDRPVFDAKRGINLPPERRDIGMVFQSYAIWPHMTVFENVALPLKARAVAKDEIGRRVADTLATVGLQAMAERSATKLSGGQQQRVALARCLASHPKLILLDEPLSNLDAKLRVEMRTEIKDLQRKLQATMLFVTHDQEEALSLADEIFLFDRGRVVQSGTPRELYFHPKTRFAAEFLGKANLIPVRLAGAPAAVEVRARDDTGPLIVTLQRASATMGDPWLMVRPEGWRIGNGGSGGLPATVEDTTFIGDRLIVRARTAIGQQIVSTGGYEALTTGDRITLLVDPDRTQLIDMHGDGPSSTAAH
jgi:iron(III) transport system ATP-binding protein